MLRLPICLSIIVILISTSYAQLDPALCPGGPTPTPPDEKWRPIPTRFEIMAELVSGDDVVEISQAFSLTRDAIRANSKNGLTQFYWNFITNEEFEVLTDPDVQQSVPKCTRQSIDPESQTSVIQRNSLWLKPSIILGYNSQNQPNSDWSIRYDSDGELRGVPTNIFKSCFYVNDINATVAATYHVLDVTKFQGFLLGTENTLLQFDIGIKDQLGRHELYVYNVFYYIRNPSRREERQALETPSGVYCVNRTATLPVPSNIPDRVSTNSEVYLPNLNNTILSSHSLYDTEFQFTRFDTWFPDFSGRREWYHLTEMHDFGVGLSYRYNHSNRQCTVSDIRLGTGDVVPSENDPNLLQMGDPQHLFLMDDMTYHYTGEKPCRDRVLCNVWIGEKTMPNNTIEHREWYWAANVNNMPLQQWIPMKLIIKTFVSGTLSNRWEISIFNYRRNPMTIFEIDYTLAECYRALGPAENYNLAVLSFKIGNEKNYTVFQNLNILRLHIWETLTFTMFIRPIRISHIIVDQDGSDILVTFTLLDAPPRTGPVEMPLEEPSLDTLLERLVSIIDANGLAFRAKNGTKDVMLRARANTLNVVHRSTGQTWLTSGPTITGLWIGCGIGGLLLGAIISFFVFEKLAKR